MPKIPLTCTVVLHRSAGRLGTITCGGEVVKPAKGGPDPYCARCGHKYPRRLNMRPSAS